MPPEQEISLDLAPYRSAFELAGVGLIHVTHDGKILRANSSFAAMIGYDARDLEGASITDFVPHDEAGALRDRLGKLAEGAGGGAGVVDRRYRHRDGRSVWLSISACWVPATAAGPGFILGVVFDISDRKKQDQELRESEARLELVMESGRIGVWELDTATKAVKWSKVFRKLIGLSPEVPAQYEEFLRLLHPEDREWMSARAERLKGGEHFVGHDAFRVVHPDGSVHWLKNLGRPVSLGEPATGKLIGAIVDVTEAREAERTIEAQRAKMTSTSKMSALGEMAGGLAHEINNPVAIIHGNALLLQQLSCRGAIDPGQMQEIARVIALTAERISKITRSLLAFARDADQDPFERASVRKLLDETVEFCQRRFSGHGVVLTVESIEPGLQIDCRPVQISQVLLNLLNNAHDAVESLPQRWIRISVRDLGAEIEVRVTDSGAGIDAAVRDKIFQPFFTTKEVGRGTGLGLSVAAGLIESHSGDLRLDESCANTRFIFTLPKSQRKPG